jgi:hypothetical protein
MIGNVVLVNSGFHTRKNFFENYSQFGILYSFALKRRYVLPAGQT